MTNQSIKNNLSTFSCCSQNNHNCSATGQKSIEIIMADAKTQCQHLGVRFTKLRQQVYELILTAKKPIGAYDLLNKMQQAEQTKNTNPKNIAPPTVYRSLDFLLEVGFIHQLNSINAFVPCCHPRGSHMAGFLICNVCENVQELSNDYITQFLTSTKKQTGFAIEQSVIEITGTCQNCQAIN